MVGSPFSYLSCIKTHSQVRRFFYLGLHSEGTRSSDVPLPKLAFSWWRHCPVPHVAQIWDCWRCTRDRSKRALRQTHRSLSGVWCLLRWCYTSMPQIYRFRRQASQNFYQGLVHLLSRAFEEFTTSGDKQRVPCTGNGHVRILRSHVTDWLQELPQLYQMFCKWALPQLWLDVPVKTAGGSSLLSFVT